MPSDDKGFDAEGFYRALEAAVSARSKTWKQVAKETGVSASTLTRMSQGRSPDAASLAALSAWAGINPSDFVQAPYRKKRPAAISQISSLLRNDFVAHRLLELSELLRIRFFETLDVIEHTLRVVCHGFSRSGVGRGPTWRS